MTFDFTPNTAEASWLTESTPGDFQEGARTLLFGPSGFGAYGRILSVPDPQYPGQPESEIDDHLLATSIGDAELVRRAVEMLREATDVPDDLYFLFWEGWPYDPPLPNGSRVNIASMRGCALARGTAAEWADWVTAGVDRDFPPSFVWPSDRAWCVTFDVDAHFAGVAGSEYALTLLIEGGLNLSRSNRDIPPPMYG